MYATKMILMDLKILTTEHVTKMRLISNVLVSRRDHVFGYDKNNCNDIKSITGNH